MAVNPNVTYRTPEEIQALREQVAAAKARKEQKVSRHSESNDIHEMLLERYELAMREGRERAAAGPIEELTDALMQSADYGTAFLIAKSKFTVTWALMSADEKRGVDPLKLFERFLEQEVSDENVVRM